MNWARTCKLLNSPGIDSQPCRPRQPLFYVLACQATRPPESVPGLLKSLQIRAQYLIIKILFYQKYNFVDDTTEGVVEEKGGVKRLEPIELINNPLGKRRKMKFCSEHTVEDGFIVVASSSPPLSALKFSNNQWGPSRNRVVVPARQATQPRRNWFLGIDFWPP